VHEVVQSDDGRFRHGVPDAGPGAETRSAAAAMLTDDWPPDPPDKMRSPRRANPRANRISCHRCRLTEIRERSPERKRGSAAMSGSGMNWQRCKPRKPTRSANIRFSEDELGKRAKDAWRAWTSTLSRPERRNLFAAPTR
jgi:hypothetical protein